MGTLRFRVLNSEEGLKEFDCGIESINQLIYHSYLSNVCHQAIVIEVLCKDTVIAYCKFSIKNISLDKSDLESNHSLYYEKEPVFSAVCIDYIAVRKEVQHKKIGTTILKSMIKQAKENYRRTPIRYIILDALQERVEWYQNNGFLPVRHSDICKPAKTVTMYYDLMPSDEQDTMLRYCEGFC